MTTPTFVKLEYLTPKGWWGNTHVNLLHPHKYPIRLAANGKVGRVTIIETGEVIHGPLEPPPCPHCDEQHLPLDVEGSCLL